MYAFEDDWAAEIAEVSTRPEFQKARIRLEDQSLLQYDPDDYDIDTGNWPGPENPEDAVIYEGQARLIPIRWGVQSSAESQANATTISAVRIQIPSATDEPGYGEAPMGEGQYGSGLTGRVKRGVKVFILSSPRNPALEGLIMTITSDVQGSTAAARTFEAAFDMDVAVDDA